MNNQEEKLRQEIIGDAKAKAERTIAKAMLSADKLAEEAKKEAAEKRALRLKEAEEKAEKRCAAIMVDVQREARRHWLTEREKCIDELFAEALSNAENVTGEQHRKSLESLAKEAIAAIGCKDMKVLFQTADNAIVSEDWLKKIAMELFGKAPKFVLESSDDAHAGLAFVTLDGQRSFDNTYASRLTIMHDSLRRNLAK